MNLTYYILKGAHR